jgi:hypothetical protein
VRCGRQLEAANAEIAGFETIRPIAVRELASLTPLLQKVRETLRSGIGFALLRGFPVEQLSLVATRLAYAAMGLWLGTPVPQSKTGELMCDILDTGGDPQDPNTRLYKTNAEQSFHTDGADIIGLLCLRKAKTGGISRIVSSVSVFNELILRRPDLAPLLFDTWIFHRAGEELEGARPYFEMPIAQLKDGMLSTFFLGWYIRRSECLAGVPRLTEKQKEVLDTYEAIANDPSLPLDMVFEPGDVQWLKNSVILHKRTAYEDWPERQHKRHLLRLWLAAEDFADGVLVSRRGHITRGI